MEKATTGGSWRPQELYQSAPFASWPVKALHAAATAGRPPRRGGANVLFCPMERKYPLIRIHTRQVHARSALPDTALPCFL